MKKQEISKEATPQHKIVADKTYPFFYAYHDKAYIESHDKRPTVSLEEKGIQYILNNKDNQELVVYKIDIDKKILNKHIEYSIFYNIVGERVKDEKFTKCDYGIYTEDDILFLIELKGTDYEHGLEQLLHTIKVLITENNVSVKKLYTRMVFKIRPDIRSANARKNEDKLIKNYNYNPKLCKHGKIIEDLKKTI